MKDELHAAENEYLLDAPHEAGLGEMPDVGVVLNASATLYIEKHRFSDRPGDLSLPAKMQFRWIVYFSFSPEPGCI